MFSNQNTRQATAAAGRLAPKSQSCLRRKNCIIIAKLALISALTICHLQFAARVAATTTQTQDQQLKLCQQQQRALHYNGSSSPAAATGLENAFSPYDADHDAAEERCRRAHLEPELEEFCYAWRHKYIDEQLATGYEVRLVDKSLDERVANSIYTVYAMRPVNLDFFEFNSGDAQLDELNVQSIEGPNVNDRKCGEQLAQMLDLMEDLELRLEAKRANESLELGLDERHIRLARVLDAFGHYESGMLTGRSHAFGNYGQCVTSKLLLAARSPDGSPQEAAHQERVRVRTRFCWARMSIDKHLAGSLRARKSPHFESREKPFYQAACLPESCHSRSFRLNGRANNEQVARNRQLVQRLINTQFKLPRSLFIDESFELNSIYCMADDQSDYGLPLSGKLAVGFLTVWSLLMAYSTYYHEWRQAPLRGNHKKNDDHGHDHDVAVVAQQSSELGARGNFFDRNRWAARALDELNLKKSWQDFIDEPYDEVAGQKSSSLAPADARVESRKVELDTINPVKSFGAGFVVLGHALIYQICVAQDALRGANVVENDPLVFAVVGGTVVVDTFFVITGILLAYVAMRRSKHILSAFANDDPKTGSETTTTKRREAPKGPPVKLYLKHWLKCVVQRHLRLMPLFFIVYWFKRSLFIYGAGFGMPLWDNGFNKYTLTGACKQESWLAPFTMQAAFLPLSRQCLPQAWSVANDLFFSIVVTPILLIMTRRPRLAFALALLMGLISYGWTLSAYYAMPLEMSVELSHMRTHGFTYMFGQLHHLYTYPHFRLAAVLIGVAFGYALHNYQESERPNWPRWVRGWATKLSATITIGLFVSMALAPSLKRYMAPHERTIFTHLFTTGRILWVAANGILLIRMATDWKDTFLMKQFASGYWSRMVKLNLAILLVHMDVLAFQLGNATTLWFSSKGQIMLMYSSAYLLCIPLSIFLHVVFENPMDKLVRHYVMPALFP